jgi:hypothetical protein
LGDHRPGLARNVEGSVAFADGVIGQAGVVKTRPGFGASLPPRSAFVRFRFPAEVIVVAVRWYLRYGLSYRDVEELLAERGVEVDHVTVFRWVRAAAGRRRPVLPAQPW